MAEQSIYYFGRLNIIAEYDNKRVFLLGGLRSKEALEKRNLAWDFLDIGETTSEDFGAFIHGFLVKYRPITEEEIARPETGTIGETAIANLVVAKSVFFLHVESGLIAFHPISGQIEINQFCENFAELFEKAFDNFFVDAEIQIIEDQYKIFEVLPQFQTISRLFISLHPSNPNLSDLWKDVDEDLKKKGASKFTETYEAGGKSQTLVIADDKLIRSKIAMAEDGYGTAEVTGKLKGETTKVSTRDNPVSAIGPSSGQTPQEILDGLRHMFKQIFGRFIRPEEKK